MERDAMRRTIMAGLMLCAAGCAAGLAMPAWARPATTPTIATATAAKGASTAFAALSAHYLDDLARLDPVGATQLGDHRFDTAITDWSAAGRKARADSARATLAALARINRAALSRDDQVDAAMIDNAARYALWTDDVLQSWAWDPQIYNDTAGSALYTLAARDFAPWSVRMQAAIARMQAIPAVLAQARANLVPARVPIVHAQTVQRQNGGIVDIAVDMLAPHRDALSAADQARFDAALAGLKTAVAEHQHWLDTVLVPNAKGDFRLGAKLYDQKLAFALQSSLTRGEIKARANRAVTDTRAQMYAIAREVLGDASLPANPDAATQQRVIEAALERSYAERAPRDGLVAAATAATAQATDFVRTHQLVSVPPEPVAIITMPKFQQGFSTAYCDAPGPLEKGQKTFFAVSPVPDDWDDAKATSYLREYNRYMLHDLAVHEAMPGHYLQLAHGNHASPLRQVLGSGPFVEGWAVYAEGMMADAGYLDQSPLFKLTVLKMRLRSITNSLLDIGIQTEGMTRDQAMALMTKTAFQQEREAAGKWVRANLSSTQLLSYFTGYAEHMALRDEARRRLGARFELKAYNDAVLSHGSPPVKYVRALMFGLPVR